MGKGVRQRVYQTLTHPWFDATEMELTSEGKRQKVLHKFPGVSGRCLADIYVCPTSVCLQQFSSQDLASDGDKRSVDANGDDTDTFVDPLRVKFRNIVEVLFISGRELVVIL